ncbi:hypothetical protein ACHZ97_14780 [Lysobacter soli]|uniref:hypothetical protein n=1 Tax=Lysobacter soli TaxID=453783 RepID=UPI0037CB9D34
MTRHVFMEQEHERQAFAEQAARHFKANPQHWTYSAGEVVSGEWLALRWGLGDDCVLVFKVGDDEPVIYGQLIRHVEEKAS